MKKAFTTLSLVIALAGASFAHGKAQHIMGAVTAISANSLTLKTATGAQVIAITSQTKFLKSGAAASVKDLKSGDRVIVEAEKRDGKMEAESVRFGKPMPGMAGMPGMKP